MTTTKNIIASLCFLLTLLVAIPASAAVYVNAGASPVCTMKTVWVPAHSHHGYWVRGHYKKVNSCYSYRHRVYYGHRYVHHYGAYRYGWHHNHP